MRKKACVRYRHTAQVSDASVGAFAAEERALSSLCATVARHVLVCGKDQVQGDGCECRHSWCINGNRAVAIADFAICAQVESVRWLGWI